MDKISKALLKLSPDERLAIKKILIKLKENDLSKLDIKKLKNQNNIFRVRKGKIRVIFQKTGETTKLLAIERRKDNTYCFHV